MNIQEIFDAIQKEVFASFTGSAEDIKLEIIQKMKDVTVKYGKVAKRSNNLLEGYRVDVIPVDENTITFVLKNVAVAEGMENYSGQAKYYWHVINEGRKPVSKFRGTRPDDPFMKGITKWADARGYNGSIFGLAKLINEKGFAGTPQLFDDIVDGSKEIIDNWGK